MNMGTPLHISAINGFFKIVELLVSHGANANSLDKNISPLNNLTHHFIIQYQKITLSLQST